MTEVEKIIKEIHDGVFQEGIREGSRQLAMLLRTTHMTVDEAVKQIEEESLRKEKNDE